MRRSARSSKSRGPCRRATQSTCCGSCAKADQTTLAAPVIEMKLLADKVSEHAPQSDTLFPMPSSDSESMAQLLERLSARLGAGKRAATRRTGTITRPEAAMAVEIIQPGAGSESEAQEKGSSRLRSRATALPGTSTAAPTRIPTPTPTPTPTTPPSRPEPNRRRSACRTSRCSRSRGRHGSSRRRSG